MSRYIAILIILFAAPANTALFGNSRGVHYVLPDRNSGLFSQFCSVVGLLTCYDKAPAAAGISIDFGTTGFYFSPEKGPNWWSYYFEPIVFGNRDQAQVVEITPEQSASLAFYCLTSSPEQSNQMITKYVRVRPAIQAQVQSFIQAYFKNFFVLGVHYRGTDKFGEAPQISYQNIAKEVDSLLRATAGNKRIFIATDEQSFLDFMKARYGTLVVCQEMYRSSNGAPLHYGHQQDKYKSGLEAVLDCLLLSNCNVLFKTASNLSACSVMFNPKIKVRQISTNYWENRKSKELQQFPLNQKCRNPRMG